jgi:SAM-dependent methyltransferase
MSNESWDGAERYERYMGRWSRTVAPRFLEWLDAGSGLRWVDVGCGSGVLSEAVAHVYEPTALIGVDPSAAYVATASQSLGDSRSTFRVGDASRLPIEDSVADVVVSGLVLNFVPDAPRALEEMCRVARPDGLVGSYVWDYADGMKFVRLFWQAATAVDPAASELDQGSRFPICAPGPLNDLFGEAGLGDVATTAIEIPTVFTDLDDLWLPFLGGQGAAGRYCSALSADHLDTIRDELEARVPIQADGSIPLSARAWAVRGTKGEA